jgi:hypothetical protein
MDLVYEGSTYAGCGTLVYVEGEDGPGGGRHRYRVEHLTVGGLGSALEIIFQEGPVVEVGVNGVQDEGLLAVLIDRLRRFQAGPYSCRENALALTKLQEAFHWMEARKQERIKRGVEGKNQK